MGALGWLALWWLAGAFAGPVNAKVAFKDLPPAQEIVAMSPGNYYRVLVGEEYQKVEDVVVKVRQGAANGDPADVGPSYDGLVATLGEARKRLVGFPAYKDEDGSLRDAVIAAYVAWGGLAERERDQAAPLIAATPKSEEQFRKWEKLRIELDKGWTKSNTQIRTVVDGFATQHRLVFVDEGGETVTRAPFEAELPANSPLPDALWVAAAIRYHNALFEQAGTMVAAMNAAAAKMNTTELDPARQEALGKIKPALTEARTFGSFGGSSAFRDAVVAYGDWMVLQLEGPLKTHAELTKGGTVTRSQADQLDLISNTLNSEGAAKATALQNARAQFMSDWAFEAYLAWQAANRK